MVLSYITAKEMKVSIVSLSFPYKISVAPSLDENYKHATPFMFSKIDSINVKNNIDKNKNVRTCIAGLCT